MKGKNTLKRHKPCKRCEGMPAGRDGYCAECREELAELGRNTSLEDLRMLIDRAKGLY